MRMKGVRGASDTQVRMTKNGYMSYLIHICECAFAGCRGITTLTIPEGITSIGAVAFNGIFSGVNG